MLLILPEKQDASAAAQDSAVDVDLSLGVLPFEMEMVERSQLLKLVNQAAMPTAEDLII